MKNPKMKVCKLCHEMGVLRKSHIIPEFLYKPIYDNMHRAIKFRRDPATREYEQKGFRDYLLCQNCEQFLNDNYEKYANEVLFSRSFYSSEISGQIFFLNNLDYAKFRLFHLSILYRASISNLEFFKHVSLHEKYSEKIRLMLLNKDPGRPSEIPIVGCVIEKDNKICNSMIMQPIPTKNNGYFGYLFQYGGISWHFTLTNQGTIDFTIDIHGNMPLVVKNYLDLHVAKSFFIDHIKKNQKELDEV